MFSGSSEHTVDPKGRIIIPSRYREDLGSHFMITIGVDGCLFIYPMEKWGAFVDELAKLPGGAETRHFQRAILSNAAECEADKQGRVMIPANLREKVHIDKEIMLVGMMNKIEIWDKELWNRTNNVDDLGEIADHLAEYNLRF